MFPDRIPGMILAGRLSVRPDGVPLENLTIARINRGYLWYIRVPGRNRFRTWRLRKMDDLPTIKPTGI